MEIPTGRVLSQHLWWWLPARRDVGKLLCSLECQIAECPDCTKV